MPRNATQSPFTGQSLKGMELDVKLETQGKWDCLFAATAFDVQVAAATTSRQHTLNKGSRTSTGAAGEITATCDVFVVPDSPGQWSINQAFRTGAKVDIRRCLFGSKVGEDITLASGAKEISVEIYASPPVEGATDTAASGTVKTSGVGALSALPGSLPKSGGFVKWTDSGDNTPLKELLADAEPGMTLQVGTSNYFISYRAPDVDGNAVLFVSPSPIIAGGTTSAITGTNNSYPFIGAAIPEASTGTLRLYRGRVQQTLYKGTVTVPIVATDAAPGDDGNDLSTAQISFALDDIGESSYTFPD